MKQQDKTLTYEQARDLKWFCQNVLGVRQDMYAIMASTGKFDERLKRLEKTCMLVEKILGEKIEPMPVHDPREF